MGYRLIRFFCTLLILQLLLPGKVKGQIDLLSAMINSCGPTEGEQEFLIFNSTQNIDPSLITIHYGSTTGCSTSIVYNGPVPPPFNAVNNLNTLAGCTAFIEATNPIPAGANFIILDPNFNPNFYNGWNTYCGTNTYVLFATTPNPGGVYLNGAGTRYFCVYYNGVLVNTYSFTNPAGTSDGTIAYWTSGTSTTTELTVPPCDISLPCTPPSFSNPGPISSCGPFQLPIITGINLSGNEAYFSGANGSGMTFNAGDFISSSQLINIYDPSSPCSPDLSFFVTITSAPQIFPAGPLEVCESPPGSGIFNLSALNNTITGGMGGTVTWFSDAPLTMTIGTPGAYMVSGGSTTVYAVIDHGSSCPSDPQPVMLNLLTQITPTFTQIGPFCSGENFTLPGTSNNGIDGIWSPVINTSSTTTYTFTPTIGQCATTTTMTVTIDLPLIPAFTQIGPFCAGENFTLPGTSNNGIDGTWSPAINTSGTTTYTFTPTAGECGTSATMTVVIDMPVTPTFTQIGPFCSGENFTLPGTSNNGINGTWSPAINNTNTTTYTFTPSAGECATTASMTVQIDASTTPTFTAIGPFCSGENFSLPNTSNNGINGTWSPAIDNTNTTTYTFTPTAGICATTATLTVTINAPVNPVFSAIGPFCVGEDFILPANSNNGIMGTWTPAVNNSMTTTYTFTPAAGSCATSTTLQVVINPLPNASASNSGAVCSGQGDIQLNASGGTSYSWSGPAGFMSSDQNPLLVNPMANAAGTYTVTVTDANGCSNTASTVVTLFNSWSINAGVINNVLCAGAQNGAISVGLNGFPALPIQNISWTAPPGVTIMLGNNNNLPSGLYAITITDNNGCTATASLTITEPEPLVVQCQLLNNETSPGANDGMGQVTVSGGTANYDIGLSGPINVNLNNVAAGTNSFSMLPPGAYIITVTDANNCAGTCAFVVQSAGCDLVANIADSQNPDCAGASTGSISVFAASSSPPFNYIWSGNTPVGNTPNGTALSAGTYIITVTDDEDCSVIISTTISNPAAIQVICSENLPATGPGNMDGIGSVNFTAGNAPFSIVLTGPVSGNFNNINLGNFDLFGLMPGNYTVDITDANGCTTFCNFEITFQACNLSVIQSSTSDVSCFAGNDGFIEFFIGGGSGNYTYSWSAGSIGNVSSVNNLNAGNYNVTVTDLADNCELILDFELVEPDELTLNCGATVNASSMVSPDGGVLLNWSGGTGPFEIEISGPVNTSQSNISGNNVSVLNQLIQGNYIVVLTDANGCQVSCDFIVNFNGCNITLQAQSVQPGCNGSSDGSITISSLGGSGNQTYNWNINPDPGTATVTMLGSGTYTVTVTDELGCTATTSVTLNGPSDIALTCTATAISSGNQDGMISLTFSGGNPPYNLNYTGPSMGNVMGAGSPYNLTNLAAGTYSLTITDSNGCTQSCQSTILDPDCNISAMIEIVQNIRCAGDTNGALSVNVTGGSGDYTYTWSPSTVPPIENPLSLATGTYTVTVHDEVLDCEVVAMVTFANPQPLVLSCDSEPTTLTGIADGILLVTVTGGTYPITINYSGPQSGQETMFMLGTVPINGLLDGPYTITITDANGCMMQCNTIIEAGVCMLSVNPQVQQVSCAGGNDGSILLFVNGSLGNTQYAWTPASIGNISNPTGLSAGMYLVTVTDQFGCSDTESIEITEPAPFTIQCETISDISVPGATDGVGRVSWMASNAPYDYTIDIPGNPISGTTPNLSVDFSMLAAGIYNVTVTNAMGCSDVCTITIEEPACTIAVGLQQQGQNLCFGDANVRILANVTGFTGNIIYTWDGPVAVEPGVTLLPAGMYSVTVQDDTGCTATSTTVITQPLELVLVCSELSPASANGVSDGSGRVNISGGTAPYIIRWNGPQSGTLPSMDPGNFSIINIRNGVYDIEVEDANGCISSCQFIIGPDVDCTDDLMIDCTIVQPASGPAVADGVIQISWLHIGPLALTIVRPSGNPIVDTAADTYTLNNAVPGNYTFYITSPDGCRDTCALTLGFEIICNLTATASITQQIVCAGQSDGSVSIATSGGTGPFSYTWADGQSAEADRSGMAAGTYAFTVTDSNNCSSEGSVVLVDPVPIIANYSSFVLSCNQSSGRLVITQISGGTAPYSIDAGSIMEDIGTLPFTINNLDPGSYSGIIADANGCSVPLQFLIPDADSINIAPIADVVLEAGTSYEINVITNKTLPELTIAEISFNGTLLCSNCLNFEFVPTTSGTMSIFLQNASGCSITYEFDITIIANTKVFFPSAFSPNADGVNDIFTAYGGDNVSKINYLRIFDRWGEEIFFLADFLPNTTTGWDGSYRGIDLNPGVYTFACEILYANGDTKLFAGDVTLLR